MICWSYPSGSWYVFVIVGELDPLFDSIDLCLSIFMHIWEYCCVFLWMFSVLKRDADTKTSPKRRWSAFCFGLPWKTAKPLKPCRILSFFWKSPRYLTKLLNMCCRSVFLKYVLKILSRLLTNDGWQAWLLSDSPPYFWGLWSMVNKSQRSMSRLSALQFELGKSHGTVMTWWLGEEKYIDRYGVIECTYIMFGIKYMLKNNMLRSSQSGDML